MLACLISDTWNNRNKKSKVGSGEGQEEEEKEDNIIFIDADGLHFRYVLEYMRHQKVDLLMNVSKASVFKDLKYFGFEDIPPTALQVAVLIWNMPSIGKCVVSNTEPKWRTKPAR